MHMELQVLRRTILGKKTRTLRKQGLIPAELFGRGIENKHLSVPVKDFSKIYKSAGESTVINLIAEDGKKVPVLISDIQRHPTSDEFLTIDFHQIKMDEKIQIKIPVEFTGEAPAIKTGNILIKAVNELEVETLPGNIPHNFTVDLSVLESVRQSIHVRDLRVPASVKIIADPETVIATIAEPRKIEEMPPATPLAEETAAETIPTAETPQTEGKKENEPK